MKYLTSLKNDISNNFLVVSIPAFFTNSIWRMMNLHDIAVTGTSKEIILETIKKISPIVFIVCFFVDALRQQLMYKKINFRHSFNLGFKFYLASIFWTIGYELSVNKDNKTRAFTSGVGTSSGLMLSSLIKTFGKHINTALGVSARGFFEGYTWSAIGDLDLYKKWGKLLDSVTVGLTSSLAFALGSIVTFTFWYLLR